MDIYQMLDNFISVSYGSKQGLKFNLINYQIELDHVTKLPQIQLQEEKNYKFIKQFSDISQLTQKELLFFEKSQKITRLTKVQSKKQLIVVETEKQLEQCMNNLIQNYNVVGIDTEHFIDKIDKYKIAFICTIQLSTIDVDYVIDAMRFRHICNKYLKPIFENQELQKIFHGCDVDIIILFSDLKLILKSILDSSKIDMALIKSPNAQSLEKLCKKHLNIHLDKLYQRSDWRIRPLPKEVIDYARLDSDSLLFQYPILIDEKAPKELYYNRIQQMPQLKYIKANFQNNKNIILMIRNFLRPLAQLQKRVQHVYYFSFSKQNKLAKESSQLILKNQEFDKLVEYWDNKVSQPKQNSVSIQKVLQKIHLAENLIGSELQDKNWEFFEEMFDKNFIERLYIPKQYPQKIQLILNISMELSLLEYHYRLNRREIQLLELVLERIKGILENIYNFESKISDLGEAEFNNLLRQSQYFDMKAFYQKTLNPEGYVQFLEESTKCLDQAVKIVNDIIKHKENVEQIKYQVGKQQAMSKIARNFEILAEFLLISGQEEEARSFLEKAHEIYETFASGITPKSILCQCRIARSYLKENYEKSIQLIQELYDEISQYGESEFLLLVQMYKFVIQSQKEVNEADYEKLFETMKNFRVTDPFIISEVLLLSIEYTFKQGYSKALSEHIHQALILIENSSEKINLEQLLHLTAQVIIELPVDIKDQQGLLKVIYENFEKFRNQIDDAYFQDHLLLQALIRAKLLQFDKQEAEAIIKPILQFIEQAQNSKEPQFLNHIKQIQRFLEKNGLLFAKKQIEDLSSYK